jgi:hypothetical protein
VKYGAKFPNPLATKLRRVLRLSASHTFSEAFPNTTLPKWTMFSNQPRLVKEEFSNLLTLKLDQARRFFGLNQTPKCLPRMITSWINSLFIARASLKRKPTPASQKQRKSEASKQKAQNPDFLELTFVRPERHTSDGQAHAEATSPRPSSPDSADIFADFEFNGPYSRDFSFRPVSPTARFATTSIPPPLESVTSFDIRNVRDSILATQAWFAFSPISDPASPPKDPRSVAALTKSVYGLLRLRTYLSLTAEEIVLKLNHLCPQAHVSSILNASLHLLSQFGPDPFQ